MFKVKNNNTEMSVSELSVCGVFINFENMQHGHLFYFYIWPSVTLLSASI